MAKYTEEDRQLQKQVSDSLKVSSYKDDIIDALVTGQKVKPNVPNLSDGSPGEYSNESTSLFSIFDSSIMGPVSDSPNTDQSLPIKTAQAKNINKISHNQDVALKKYPALIDFLGTPAGDSIVKEIASKINEIMVVKIHENTKAVSKYAGAYQVQKQNIKQFFTAPDESWACCVIASGPFRGDEAFFYNPETDKASILRKSGDDYINVTDEFNMIHESATEQIGGI